MDLNFIEKDKSNNQPLTPAPTIAHSVAVDAVDLAASNAPHSVQQALDASCPAKMPPSSRRY